MSEIYRLQAPSEDSAFLAYPPLQEVPQLLEKNRRLRSATILGRDISELCAQARGEALAAARDYLQSGGEPLPKFSADSIMLAGHQPELFHPGVWIKNFTLNRMAHKHGAVPIHLIVDNDEVKSTSLAVPDMVLPPPPIDEFAPTRRMIPFDHGPIDTPWEEREVDNEQAFARFPQRVSNDWGFVPLLSAFWEEAGRNAKRRALLGERFAAARRTFERRWGCHNFELPVSRLCETETYRLFFLHLATELPLFHRLHNDAVHAYRRRYGIRSRNHPVPDLAKDGDWLEAPFWSWRTDEQKRRRLFARRRDDKIELRSGEERWPALPMGKKHSAFGSLKTLKDMRSDGYKIRSRALTNTLFARVFLGDLFIHGIGGGKYDLLTDELIRGFYGIEAPGFLVISGTLRLPFPTRRTEFYSVLDGMQFRPALQYPSTVEDCRRLQRRMRDLRWNPQRHLEEVGEGNEIARELAVEKERWITQQWQDRAGRLKRLHALRQITERMSLYLAKPQEETLRQLERCRVELGANDVLRRRDYAFCLYPEKMLKRFLTTAS